MNPFLYSSVLKVQIYHTVAISYSSLQSDKDPSPEFTSLYFSDINTRDTVSKKPKQLTALSFL